MAKINWTTILIIYYAVGIAGLVIPASRSLFTSAIPFTLLASILILLLAHRPHNRRFWLVSILVFLLGLGVEMLGVATGLVFGDYQYGSTLGPRILHTPLLIGINWLMLIYCTSSLAARFVKEPWYRALLVAAMMVVYDVALEPAAIYLDMWQWEGGVVPFRNYLAWFFVSLGLAWIVGRMGLTRGKNKVAVPLFFIQLVFFMLLDIWIVIESIWGSSWHY